MGILLSDVNKCPSDLSCNFEYFDHSPGDEFYMLLYLGLFSEARGESLKAESYMRSAVTSKYAHLVGSQDYMVDV